jgi:hypothetical protein
VTVGLSEGVDGKVRLAEGGADDLGAGLAAGVGVVPAERIGFCCREAYEDYWVDDRTFGF